MDIRILLAEDEKNLRDTITLNLELEGYEVVSVADGKMALKMFDEQRFNVVILDIMMPEFNGIEVCRKIRLTNSDTPILFLTAKGTTEDKLNGFKAGGDDYITKPFNLDEFLARIRVLVKFSLRQLHQDSGLSSYSFGPNHVDFKTFKAVGHSGQEIKLTKKEALLLKLLLDRKNQVVSRQQILQYVWGYDVYPSTRTIDNFILSFRKYFESDPKNPQYIQSIRGVGYKFVE
ncbi:MAG: response regulator transcription factor [Bacteroidota bacterium]|nr:response regulator transcription factor [Bacteroidota bacterium]MEC7405393.1 response regulator transcription factor [Bacteroidota bacterium]MEC8033086.1 response regulator transcription factor [Bacteroidota bacterium]MEC8756834.1 response regulator transcription factor [Bacteroidota bacterium]MEC8834993.1 response regulator transcription factor [Bacteroidota bacterium]|tara:strand:+ start:501 stop:1196 length:696 start_codon:yes stop_codon:yes gene_type:complete